MQQTEAAKLRHIRTTKLQWTQQRMAMELGVSLRTYARYERTGPVGSVMRCVDLLANSSAAPQNAPKH